MLIETRACNRAKSIPAVSLLAGGTLALSSCLQLQPAEGSIGDRLDFYGNARVRGESTLDQTNGKNRHRGRLRARAGVKYQIAENLGAEARLSTSSGDANNAHWDFGSDGDGDGFNGSAVDLDRLYLTWSGPKNVEIKIGKMGHSFASPPIASEFVWDGDVAPAGGAAVWKPGGDAPTRGDFRIAGYVAAENDVTGGTSGDPIMVGAQGNLYLSAGENTDVQVSSSLMDWSNLGAGALGANQGNTNPAGAFAIWDSFVAVTHTGGVAAKQQAFVQFMDNIDDRVSEDKGFVFGARLGPSGRKGNTNYFASYYDLDANAVFSPVAQDDTPIAGTGVGTGMSGYIVGIQHYLADHVTWRLWGLTSDADDPSGNDPFRLRLDLDFKFL